MISKERYSRFLSLTFFALLLFFQGCTDSVKSKLPTVLGSFSLKGVEYQFSFEIASTQEQRELGLMYRSTLEESDGMIFVYPNSSYRSFWMKNTQIPLDIIFLDSNFKVLTIRKNCTPYTLNPRDSGENASQYVVELKGGISDKIGLIEGSVLTLEKSLPKGQEGI